MQILEINNTLLAKKTTFDFFVAHIRERNVYHYQETEVFFTKFYLFQVIQCVFCCICFS